MTPLRARDVYRTVGGAGARFTLVAKQVVVQAGERVAVVGPSGCGKSTLLALLALALRPDGGSELAVAGSDALGLWGQRNGDGLALLRSRHVGFVPQTGALLPFLTLRDNIRLPLHLQGRTDPARVAALAEALGISAVLDRRPAAVSVGQRQRAAVARALAHRPALVLADEPTASVHPAQADEVLSLLTHAATQDGVALVISTHDADRAAAAGYAVAPCEPDGNAALTRFGWPP